MEPREQKAIEIAAKAKLTRKGNTWIVPSQSGPKKYTVNPDPQSPNCDCPDFEARQLPCKHIMAATIVYRREYCDDGETQYVRESVTVTKTYSQEWSSYNKAQTNEKATFSRSCMNCALALRSRFKHSADRDCR